MNAINPYSGLRTIVKGEDFIGREAYINEMYEQVLTKNFCSVAIVGIPHIGKSSLMFKLYNRRSELWKERKIIVIWQTVQSTPELRRELFLTMVNSVYSSIKKTCKCQDFLLDLEEYVEILNEEHLRWSEFKHNIHEFFATLVENGIHVIACFDEFDYVKDNLTEGEYQLLRDLIDFPNYKIAIVTTSRRSIFDIERDSGGGSNLYSLLYNIHLKPFDYSDHYKHCKRIENITDNEIAELWKLTGGHPFINTLVLDKYWGCKNIKKALLLAQSDISQYFKNLFKVLNKDGLDKAVDRLYCGFIDGVPESEISYLCEKYAIFNNKEDYLYVPYSSLFLDFLKERYKKQPFNVVWPEAERAVKKAITHALKKHFNSNDYDDWICQLEKMDGIPSDRLGVWKSQKDAEIRKYGHSGSKNIVQQIYPKDLKYFFNLFWEEFLSSIFHKNLFYWLENVNFIANDIRNPIMHSRKNLLSDKDMLRAVLICQEICECVNLYFNKSEDVSI